MEVLHPSPVTPEAPTPLTLVQVKQMGPGIHPEVVGQSLQGGTWLTVSHQIRHQAGMRTPALHKDCSSATRLFKPCMPAWADHGG